MRVCLKECKDAELVRSSVPIARKNDIYENTQPETEHCSNGIAPQPNTAVDGSQKMIAPVVVSMIKYLFAHYRLQMYFPPTIPVMAYAAGSKYSGCSSGLIRN